MMIIISVQVFSFPEHGVLLGFGRTSANLGGKINLVSLIIYISVLI